MRYPVRECGLSSIFREEPEPKFLILVCWRRSTSFKGAFEGAKRKDQTIDEPPAAPTQPLALFHMATMAGFEA